jgi:hypothetical protein
MSDNVELHSKILTFLAGEFARKEERQCISVDLHFAPGNGFKEEPLRKWVRAEEPELFGDFIKIEDLVKTIIEIAEGEADAKPAGRHRFVIRTHQHVGGRQTFSFALSPTYNGSDDTALVASGGSGRPDIIAQHASQLMRINQQMFDGSIRVLSQQAQNMHEEMSALRDENNKLRRENEELRSNKEEREFQMALTMEKNARHNAGFQKLLQLGTVVAAKIGGGEEGATGGASSLAMLIGEFGKSLRKDQIDVLMNTLDMAQKIMFMEIMGMVSQPESPRPTPNAPSNGPPSLASSNNVPPPGGPKL